MTSFDAIMRTRRSRSSKSCSKKAIVFWRNAYLLNDLGNVEVLNWIHFWCSCGTPKNSRGLSYEHMWSDSVYVQWGHHILKSITYHFNNKFLSYATTIKCKVKSFFYLILCPREFSSQENLKIELKIWNSIQTMYFNSMPYAFCTFYICTA